jgi:hypothetical protein
MLDTAIAQFTDAQVAVTTRSVTLQPTFQRGYVPNVIDGFRFTLQVTGAVLMPTKIFRYRVGTTR